MRFADIDYYANSGDSWLHKLRTRYKLIALSLVLLTVIFAKSTIVMGSVYIILLLILVITKLPRLKILKLSIYPLIFMSIYLISSIHIDYNYTVLLLLKVLSASTSFATLIFTTTCFNIFSSLERIMPSTLVSSFFLTYRSIFILWKVLENIRLALYIKGKPSIKRPIYTLQVYSHVLGYLVIRAIESSESMYNSLKLRGYSNSLRYLRK